MAGNQKIVRLCKVKIYTVKKDLLFARKCLFWPGLIGTIVPINLHIVITSIGTRSVYLAS